MIETASPSHQPAQPLSGAAPDASRIALEVARVLRQEGFAAANEPRSHWISLEDAAGIFGYSVSRFYHVYKKLGLVPSRASKRKLRFHRQEVEQALRDRQRVGRGRPRKQALL